MFQIVKHILSSDVRVKYKNDFISKKFHLFREKSCKEVPDHHTVTSMSDCWYDPHFMKCCVSFTQILFHSTTHVYRIFKRGLTSGHTLWQVDWFLMLCKSELFISLHAVIFLGYLENVNPGLHEKTDRLKWSWGDLRETEGRTFSFLYLSVITKQISGKQSVYVSECVFWVMRRSVCALSDFTCIVCLFCL